MLVLLFALACQDPPLPGPPAYAPLPSGPTALEGPEGGLIPAEPGAGGEPGVPGGGVPGEGAPAEGAVEVTPAPDPEPPEPTPPDPALVEAAPPPSAPDHPAPDPSDARSVTVKGGIAATEREPVEARTGQKLVTIRGVVQGSRRAQVRFMTIESGKVVLHHVARALDGSFTAQAPAGFDQPVYVTACVDADGDGADEDDPWGAPARPLQVGTADMTLTVTLGEHPDWAKALTPPPWKTLSAEEIIHWQ